VFAGRQSVNTYSPDGARAIALRAGELVVLTKRQTIDVFSRADGSLLHSWRIPRGLARTVDVHFGVAVFTIGRRAFALRLSNGRIAPLVKTPGAVAAQIDDVGVVYRYNVRGQGYLGFIPFPVVVMAVLAVCFSIVMRRTRFGRHVYATGGNETAARLSGVRTARVKFTVYALSGAIAALAGVLAFSRFVSAEPAAGFGAELDVIAAAAIGGASLSGGVGSVEGAIIGAALAGIITNGVVLLNIDTYAQQTITGCVILIAVSIDIWRLRSKGR